VAVIGAPTEEGARVREALAEVGVPGSRVDLYGRASGEAVLSEYAGEARLIQQASLEEIAQHDVVFLCEDGEASLRLVAALAPDRVVIDLVGCLAGSSPRVDPAINPEVAPPGGGRYVVPHPLALLLAELLQPIHRELGLVEAVAVILRPASDFGDAGVEELREQVVRLLSFSRVPVETFGRQLAFNVLPGAAPDRPELEQLLASDVAALLGWPRRKLAVRLITVPLFHGHGLQLRLRLAGTPGPERVREVLRGAGLGDPGGVTPPATPLDVTGEVQTVVSDLVEDGLGGFWLWVAAGETRFRSARAAVRLASRLAPLT
jgi:aspartate-semialdehyde dehydrogenase